MHYLLKTEPTEYSFADLERDKTTVWDGVTNPVAVKNLRGMQKGDELVIYHTGDEKRTVGTASVVAVDAADPKSPRVTIKAGKPLPPVSLAEIKANPAFASMVLVKSSRLSVQPVTADEWKRITDLGS